MLSPVGIWVLRLQALLLQVTACSVGWRHSMEALGGLGLRCGALNCCD